MTAFLDELAKNLARPMPRRRALRLFAGATVGAWLHSSGSVALAGTARAAHVCDTRVSKEGWKYCTQATEACFPTCCPREWACCKGKCGNNGCCEMFCCNPCDPQRSRCIGAGVCGRGPVRPDCCGGEIRPGRQACGDACCERGETCADPDLGYCCPIRTKPCRGGNTVDCCKTADEFCCSGTCCPPRTRCKPGKPGKCVPCPKGSKKCGKTCCVKGESCCNGKCCPASQKCCPSDICCKKTAKCCGETCCPERSKCCDDHCCPEPKTCCGDGCCPAETTCIKERSGGYGCCPEERVLRTPTGPVCCFPNHYAEQGTCCRTGRECTPCDPPCRRGEFCQEGFCLQIP